MPAFHDRASQAPSAVALASARHPWLRVDARAKARGASPSAEPERRLGPPR